MRLSRWQFRVLDAFGNLKQTVDMTQSNVATSGLRFEVMPYDTGQCSFQARPDGPALAWGDILEINGAEAGQSLTRLYRGEARTVGQPGSRELVQYNLTSLAQALSETEMPEMTVESMDAGAQVRQVLEVLTATQVWGNAIYYDPAKVPDIGVIAPKLTATNYQILRAYLDEVASYVNGKKPDQTPIVCGVDKNGYLRWGRNPGATLDLTAHPDVIRTDWGSVVCEAPCTAVRWFLKPFQSLGAATVLSKNPAASTLRTRVTRQTLSVLDIWESVTDLNTAPAGSPYTWADVAPADRQKLQDGTAAVETVFDSEPATFINLFSITPESPWVYARFTGTVTPPPPDAAVEFSIVPYDSGQSINIQAPVTAAGQFDVILPAKTDLKLGGTGVRSNINFMVKTGSGARVVITFSRAGYYAPNQDDLDYLAQAFYQLPDALIGSVELRTLQPDPPRLVKVKGPLGTVQTATATTEYIISAGQYGHTIYKIGDPDPANIRATRQLNDLRLRDAAAQALAAIARN